VEARPVRVSARALPSAGLTSEKARRWGLLPAYHGWQGELVQASPEVEEAILRAMGATGERPPPQRRPKVPDLPSWPPPERMWGWAVQLYALRSGESWGVGDLADLRRFARWSRRAGASVILLNPLGAQTPTLPYQPSPYYSSTRRFRNVVYLRVEDVEGADRVDIAAQREAGRALNSQRLIDYDRVFVLKTDALAKIFAAAPRPAGLASYVARQGAALRAFAGFNAERNTQQKSEAFEMWLQFHVDRQLARVEREIGLIIDVPVGFASDGFDAWRWRDYLAPGVRVGAPPDEFFRDGQDWGIPAFDPWRLGGARWEPFIDAIRSAATHAAGVRLDHVMGLFRLFWIPDGMTAAQGAYVRYPAPILLRLLANESRRARAFVIGEDLGLVEPTVRKHLRRKGSLSYRLVWFEGSDPDRWPRDAVAAVGTHDLPTVAGIWTLSEPEHRLHHLRQKLVDMTHLPDDTPPVEVALAVYGRLARGRPRIVLASLEDALGVHERPNVPGTIREFPNWRLALPVSLEEIEQADSVRRLTQVMRDAGR
jgi:4-alpha-glucanotransferase